MDIDDLKKNLPAKPKYILSEANVFVSPEGWYVIDYLDPVVDIAPKISGAALDSEMIEYIERQLQSRAQRFDCQVDAMAGCRELLGAKVLDVGCGGGG